jgi:hypothetical protein
MRLIPVAMQGTIIVGVPVGTHAFVNTALSLNSLLTVHRNSKN